MTVNIKDLIGDYAAFFAQQRSRMADLEFDIGNYPLSHIAYRAPTGADYIRIRDELEKCCDANVENEWRGRAISKLQFSDPLDLGNSTSVSMLELIPPPHKPAQKTGLEHVAVVLGEHIEPFAQRYREVLIGENQSSLPSAPYRISFKDGSSVKFYRVSLKELVIGQGFSFDGFYHAADHEGSGNR